ncbi:hypothetical protein ABIB62_002324 [Mucilaginibacter sp. UYP25]|uniref:hypothetical protein n=1 Tax=unclassified Mucilaginibacter TaxID=2617802 RepID=UPI003390DB0B
MNSYLQEIEDESDVNRKLSFHTAVLTFATTFTLTNGILIEQFQKCLGTSHSSKQSIMKTF